MDLSSLVDREGLQEIVNTELEAKPLRCPPIENYRWNSLTAHHPYPTARGEIEKIPLEMALDAEVLVRRKVIELVTRFRKAVTDLSTGSARTLMKSLHRPTVRVELHDPLSIWLVVLQWEVNFDPIPADNALPVVWIAGDR